ncbi:hypothetical protein M670_03151 [Schinkia azotoformans MEV2011]|uniref:Uncharacterized protein n=1 Tax=Schinkia azotoformans MEV2011 TaxID=1348973 RepID=A0A072NJZ1_SCHAZ|nr:hypothetical protein [Schinkia azotoformans]KEF37572.1 hypothetical protein M670_03151 [Schinkia azotoformans MEV2011]MEC1695298.1 hypothetical protein [Schinkia azotoformans]MEC1724678.1 hypothetical protein [Schinkia azotoformans]MEC1778016.1 hypothetical protein [Schinkia azotoformans]MED4330951.1 hypothetical protein [Schinkia azotoformans]
MLKKYLMSIIVVLSTFLLIFSSSTSYAKENTPKNLKESKIEKLKLPADYLEQLDPIILEDILNNENIVEFDSSTTYTWSEEKQELIPELTISKDGTEYFNDEDKVDGGVFNPFATIPTDKFSITIDVYSLVSSDNRKRKQIYSRYEWYSAPAWLLYDPFGVAWSDKWRATDNTSRKVDYYKSPSATNWTVHEDTNALAYSGAYGVGWDANLYGWAVNDYTQLRGYGSISIETISSSNPTGTDQIHTNYAHKKGTGTLGLTFAGIAVSVTGNADHDTRGNYKTFSY